MPRLSSRIVLLHLLGWSTLSMVGSLSCSSEPSEDFHQGGFAGRPEWGDGGATGLTLPCKPPNAEPLPARSAVMSATPETQSKPIFVRDLFNSFQSHCGGCHVDTSLGGFDDQRVNFQNFPQLVDQEAVDVIKSDDPEVFMPKPVGGGKPWSERKNDDPVRELARLLEAWIAAGSPTDLFFLKPEKGAADSPYLLSKEQGNALTNIGNCMPDAALFATEEERSASLDGFFASASELPERLEETDLFTLDHALLAYHGVVATAPAYPLWSDSAGKIRHVRLPRGKSLQYDAKRREFDIPDNTRFYKTFLKRVVDSAGREAWRKVETRLIVARKDDCSSEPCQTRALFGAYAWNEAETEAVLVRDPLRSGEPFRDRVITYVTDEVKAKAAGADAALLAASTRHYAIPGSDRCVQCHMGSPTQSFVLGFSPLQLNRRPYVEEPDPFALGEDLLGHGILEEDAPREDELSQLTRLIELGVVSGLESADDVPGLRDSQSVPPRNDYELRAQGYMLGNCSNCHNPLGFPTQKNPELRDLLDFYPTTEGGGIFQFPLERYSPRVRRGQSSEFAIPYITPSLWDLDENPVTHDNGVAPPTIVNTTSKWMFTGAEPTYILAPWRSMIYRNTDTPFTYSDHFAIFQRMPRHVAGYDCRVPRLMGEWMVSIPAAPKVAGQEERLSLADQPWVAVDPASETKYRLALNKAKDRLEQYQQGERYAFCPDTSDIQDPEVLANKYIVPQDYGQVLQSQPFTPWYDNVPDRAHWVVTDQTEVPGDWTPRRADWADVLLKEDQTKYDTLEPAEKRVVDELSERGAQLTPAFRKFALEQRPFGLWSDPNSVCKAALSAMPTLDQLATADRPRWFEFATITEKAKPIYSTSPGAAVFGNICRNCHGPAGDARSPLADTISDLTGGATRVANLRDGLFGPVDDPGSARAKVFGKKAEDLNTTSENFAARYLLWMALGGTQVQIPPMALKLVDNTLVLGLKRKPNPLVASANMLATAEKLCAATLPNEDGGNGQFNPLKGLTFEESPLLRRNGDLENWVDLCNWSQRAPVRVVRCVDCKQQAPRVGQFQVVPNGLKRLIDADVYGESLVMTPAGVRSGVPNGEAMAWCLEKPLDAVKLGFLDEFRVANLVDGQPIPYCPDGLLTWSQADIDEYTLRGAINAGLAVFAYLDAIAKGEVEPQLLFDECQKLAKP